MWARWCCARPPTSTSLTWTWPSGTWARRGAAWAVRIWVRFYLNSNPRTPALRRRAGSLRVGLCRMPVHFAGRGPGAAVPARTGLAAGAEAAVPSSPGRVVCGRTRGTGNPRARQLLRNAAGGARRRSSLTPTAATRGSSTTGSRSCTSTRPRRARVRARRPCRPSACRACQMCLRTCASRAGRAAGWLRVSVLHGVLLCIARSSYRGTRNGHGGATC